MINENQTRIQFIEPPLSRLGIKLDDSYVLSNGKKPDYVFHYDDTVYVLEAKRKSKRIGWRETSQIKTYLDLFHMEEYIATFQDNDDVDVSGITYVCGILTDGTTAIFYQKLKNGVIVELGEVQYNDIQYFIQNKKKVYPSWYTYSDPREFAKILKRQAKNGYDQQNDGDMFYYDYSTITPSILNNMFRHTNKSLRTDLNQHYTPYELAYLCYQVIKDENIFFDPCGGSCGMLVHAMEDGKECLWSDVDTNCDVYPELFREVGYNIDKAGFNPSEVVMYNHRHGYTHEDEYDYIVYERDARCNFELMDTVSVITNPPFGNNYVNNVAVKAKEHITYKVDGYYLDGFVRYDSYDDALEAAIKKYSKGKGTLNHKSLDIDIIVNQFCDTNVNVVASIVNAGHLKSLVKRLEELDFGYRCVYSICEDQKLFNGPSVMVAVVWMIKKDDVREIFYHKGYVTNEMMVDESFIDSVRELLYNGNVGSTNFIKLVKYENHAVEITTDMWLSEGKEYYVFKSNDGRKKSRFVTDRYMKLKRVLPPNTRAIARFGEDVKPLQLPAVRYKESGLYSYHPDSFDILRYAFSIGSGCGRRRICKFVMKYMPR